MEVAIDVTAGTVVEQDMDLDIRIKLGDKKVKIWMAEHPLVHLMVRFLEIAYLFIILSITMMQSVTKLVHT